VRLIVGLGNPGRTYAFTRHNVGVMVLEHAAARWAIPLKDRGRAHQGRGRIDGVEVALAMPLAWMNESGPVVAHLLHDLDVSVSDLLVVHDDVDLPVGRLRIKREGGAGGHNGIRSIQDALDRSDFCRLKLGVGRPTPGQETADYVLSPIGSDERPLIQETVERAVAALEYWIREGVEAAMNRFNAAPLSEA
jgi:PTH1 family peptidyl-tRNA hydrolase